MAPKRRPASDSASSSASEEGSSSRRSKKKPRNSRSDDSDDESRPLRVYIVQAKLVPNAVNELYQLVEGFASSTSEAGHALEMELCPDVNRADIIITAVRMKPRLERHVSWDVARQKAIVTLDWLRNSAKAKRLLPCGDYAALPELEEETKQHCPDPGQGTPDQGRRSQSPSDPHAGLAALALRETDPGVFRNWRSKYACQRASPLVCPNESLARELSILCRDREQEGLQINALAYERAIGMVKSYPNVITKKLFDAEFSNLPGMSGKIASKVQEFIETGSIPEAQTTLASERYQALSSFTSIYGIGPAKARQFYDMGMRSISDLERYYDITPGSELTTPAEVDALLGEIAGSDSNLTPNGQVIRTKNNPPDITIPVALALRGEFRIPIPRDEVEEIRDVVMRELVELQSGCVCTIVGGYRRGKPASNDVDIVFSHSDPVRGKDIIPGLCKRLTARLYKKGLITHVMHLSGFHSYNALRTEHWDTLEKSLTVFKLPPRPGTERLHRRLDLIFALPESYWTAVTGWTGSKMFERDLRLWAKREKGMKFDSVALTRRHDTRRYLPKSEKEVFDILGLPWIDPTMRNADA